MVNIQIFGCLLAAWLTSCTDNPLKIRPERKSELSFVVHGSEALWKSNNVQLTAGPSFIRLVGNPAQPYTFRRYFFNAEGITTDNQRFVLMVYFDTSNEIDLRNSYSTNYSSKGGLNQITLLVQRDGVYESMELCPATYAFFEINRQSKTEKLISGEFSGSLCLIGFLNPVQILQASFRDVSY
ncbi:MAG: hypothetical protein KF856_12695 [Cyclobacteriaceae bacterium]|nr:hypothetical protein [Cyclobacteriaceae bacterium]